MRARITNTRRRARGRVLLIVLSVCALAIGANVLPSAAQEPPPPPISTELLTGRAAFTDDVDLKFKLDGGTDVVNVKDPSRTAVARITVQPGAQFPWHTHPGPVVANVVQGELVYIAADDCKERAYPAGTTFVDAGGDHVHTAVNRTNAPTVVVATFFRAPAEGPLTIPVQAPANCTV